MPALFLLGRGEERPGDLIALWTLPGYMGAVPGVLYLALLVEAAIRGQRREEHAPESAE